jgi:tetratricopeptide (TPR) repeat protein
MFPHARVVVPAAIAAFWLFGQPVFGQRGGTSPGGIPSTGPAIGTPSGGIGQNPSVETQQRPFAPVFLTGQVALEDGSPPPGHVAIVMFCSGRQRTIGYADMRGYFNVQLGSLSPEVFDDASVGGGHGNGQPSVGGEAPNSRNTGDEDMVGCELRARLAGYDSQELELGARARLDNPNVGTILMRRLGPDEGTTVSVTTLAAPKDARKAYEKALEAEKKNKLPDAQASLEKAVTADPKYALAWMELGKVQAAQGQADAARNSLQQSMASDPKFVPPYVEIAQLEFRAHDWQPLAQTTEKATGLDPFHYPIAFFLNGVANYNLHNLDRAEESVKRAEKLDVNHKLPQTFYLMGLILADRKNYAAAVGQVAEYLKLAPKAPDAAEAQAQLAHLEEQAKTNPGAPQP